MDSLEGVFDVGAAVGQSVQKAEAGEPLLESMGIVREVFLIGGAGINERPRLRVADDEAVALVEQCQEILELKSLSDAGDHQRFEQPISRRITHAAARAPR